MATETAPAAERPRTPDEIERDWYENVYQGDKMPQLTPRALIMGMLLGAVMSTSNIYVGLRAGWSLGVAITSCILAYTSNRMVPYAGLIYWLIGPVSGIIGWRRGIARARVEKSETGNATTPAAIPAEA